MPPRDDIRAADRAGAAVAAVILAAGGGERYGRPKALARIGSETWLHRALGVVAESGYGWVTVVVGAEADDVQEEIERARTELEGEAVGRDRTLRVSSAVNPDWRAGRTGSLIRGLDALSPDCRGALVHQVDFPLVTSRTLCRLREEFALASRCETLVLLPTTAGRRGHPIVLGRAVWDEVHRLRPDEPLRHVIRRDPGRIREIEVDDPGIHRNVNRPGELEVER